MGRYRHMVFEKSTLPLGGLVAPVMRHAASIALRVAIGSILSRLARLTTSLVEYR